MPTSPASTTPARRSIGRLSIVVLAGWLIACTGAPSSSPTPTPGGSSPSPTPAGSPPGSPRPTTTSQPTPTQDSGLIAHPTGAHEVVLRMETSGGFAPVEFFAAYTPEFTLYGDGTIIFRPLTDMAEPTRQGPARFVRGRLSEEGVQALLRFALGAGRLLDAREHYQATCADCTSTHFTLNAAGLARQVQVDGLGQVDEVGPDALDRRAFAMLAETLNGFEQRARNGELGEASLYDPSHYRVFLFEGFGEPRQVGEWPWDDVTPADFVADGDDWRLRAILDRARVARLTDVPSPGQAQLYFVDEAGKLWELAVRPLLPDELAAEGLD